MGVEGKWKGLGWGGDCGGSRGDGGSGDTCVGNGTREEYLVVVGMAKGYKLLVTFKKISFLCSYFSDDRRGKWDKGQKIQLTRDQSKIFLAGV